MESCDLCITFITLATEQSIRKCIWLENYTLRECSPIDMDEKSHRRGYLRSQTLGHMNHDLARRKPRQGYFFVIQKDSAKIFSLVLPL